MEHGGRPGPRRFTNARIIDGTGGAPFIGWIEVEGDRIAAVGAVADSHEPERSLADVVDLSGRTIVPGLIDLHTHAVAPTDLDEYLRAGITTARCAGLDMPTFRSAREDGQRRFGGAPRLMTAGPMLDSPPPVGWEAWSIAVQTPREAHEAATRLLDVEGTDALIAVAGLRPDLLRAAVEVAHDRGRPVFGQLWRTDTPTAVEIGIDQLDSTSRVAVSRAWDGERIMSYGSVTERLKLLAHIWTDIDWDATGRIMDLMIENDVPYCPTLTVWESQGLQGDISTILDEGSRPIDRSTIDAWTRMVRVMGDDWSPEERSRWRAAFDVRLEWLRRFRTAGGTILVGTDVPAGGRAYLRELRHLVDIGMSPPEVITAATGRAARAMRRTDLGFLRPGALADLVVVRGDPTEDIGALADVETVVVGGRAVAV